MSIIAPYRDQYTGSWGEAYLYVKPDSRFPPKFFLVRIEKHAESLMCSHGGDHMLLSLVTTSNASYFQLYNMSLSLCTCET